MKDYVECPEVIAQARKDFKGYFWLVEALIVALIFVAGSIVQGIVMMPVEFVVMFTNPDIVALLQSGDVESYAQAVTALVQTAPMLIASLFAEIGLIASVLVLGKFVGKLKIRNMGFCKKGCVKEYLAGAAAGFVMFSVAVLLCVATGAVRLSVAEAISPLLLVLFFGGFMIQGMAEEVLCRGYMMVAFSRRYGIAVGIFVNAVLFGALHLANAGISVLALINLILFGLTASLYFIKRGDIWGIAALHSVWNFVQGNFYGIKVSGMDVTESVFIASAKDSMWFINGGDFGLEGGFAVTLVLAASIIILWKMKGRKVAVNEEAEAVMIQEAAAAQED